MAGRAGGWLYDLAEGEIFRIFKFWSGGSLRAVGGRGALVFERSAQVGARVEGRPGGKG